MADPRRGAPRRLSNLPLPPYAHLPGRSAHPRRDPRGHRVLVEAPESSEEAWRYAIDLYNFGYFFEAHVAFEYLWRRAGGDAFERDTLKAMIGLAAALLKLKLGQESAARRLADRAAALLARAATRARDLRGLDLDALARATRTALVEPDVVVVTDAAPFRLELSL